ncbi:MAG: c-type cytochrome domain-containing protein, partial [Gimesia chilikensis]
MNGIRLTSLLLILLYTHQSLPADGDQFFRESVEPILKAHCYDCHSHSAGVMEGELTLDWQSGWKTGGSRGAAIVPGQPEQSLLIKAIRHTDPDLKMPDEKLSDQQIAILTKWVGQGAPDPRISQPQADTSQALDWWTIKPLTRPTD